MIKSTAILDIGSSKITALVGKRGVGGMLVVEASSECDYSGYINGEFLDTVELFSAIDRVLVDVERKIGFPITNITVGVPGQFTITECKDLSYSFEKRHKLIEEDIDIFHKQAGDFNYEGYELLHIQPVYYIGEDNRKMISAIGIVTKKLSGNISFMYINTAFKAIVCEAINGHGINNCDFVSTVLAESVFLVPDTIRDNYAVIIDIGYLVTDVAVVRGDGIIRQLSFSLGGGHITRAIVENLDIKYKIAEQVKRKIIYNLDFSDSDNYCTEYGDKEYRFNAKDVNECAQRIINKIIRTIIKNLDVQLLPQDTKFYLTGGGVALNIGIRDYFSKNLDQNIEIAFPPIPQYERADLSSSLAILSLAATL